MERRPITLTFSALPPAVRQAIIDAAAKLALTVDEPGGDRLVVTVGTATLAFRLGVESTVGLGEDIGAIRRGDTPH